MTDVLVRIAGWRGSLIHGDAMVLDRWTFLRRRLPKARNTGERILDVGCGTGAITMGAANRGYETVGLSWDERNQAAAGRRATLSGLKSITFPIGDARLLDKRTEFTEAFDIVICFEVIEHILDDRKLMRDIFDCLKPGGRLLLTSPHYYYAPMSMEDKGPFRATEDGWHVRRGYSEPMLRELCSDSGFAVEEVTYIGHFFSQLVVRLHRALTRLVGPYLVWPIIMPLRILPPILDGWVGRWLSRIVGWPGYSIALSAYKPRFESLAPRGESMSGTMFNVAR